MRLDTPAKRLRKGIEAFTDIAQHVEGLEGDLTDYKNKLGDRESRLETMQRELEEIADAEPLIEDLEDVLRGIFTLDEICERWGIDPR